MYLFSLFFAHLTKARVLITLSIDIFGKDVNFCTTLISSMQVYHPTFWMIVQSSSFCFPNSAGKKLNKNKNTCKIYFASSWHLNRKKTWFYHMIRSAWSTCLGQHPTKWRRWTEIQRVHFKEWYKLSFNCI